MRGAGSQFCRDSLVHCGPGGPLARLSAFDLQIACRSCFPTKNCYYAIRLSSLAATNADEDVQAWHQVLTKIWKPSRTDSAGNLLTESSANSTARRQLKVAKTMNKIPKERRANPESGYGSYAGAPSKATHAVPKRGTARPQGNHYGATTKGGKVSGESPKGIFGSKGY